MQGAGSATGSRAGLVRVGLTAITTTGLVVALYYILPVQPPHQSPLLRTAVGIAAFVAILALEVRAIVR